MSDVDDDIRSALERLTDPESAGPGGTWEGLVARRRRRRLRRTAVTMLPAVLFAGVVAFTVGVLGGDDADRTEVATTPDEGFVDFSPFEMRYAVSSMVNLELVTAVWELDYDSVESWELVLVQADPALGLEAGRRQVFADGTLTDYWSAGEAGITDGEVDDRVAPLALMSRGPRTRGPIDGDAGARHEFSSSQSYECPVEDAPPWCDEPGQAVVLESIEIFNGDGVPVFAEDRVRGTDVVIWKFEMLSYERIEGAPVKGPPPTVPAADERGGVDGPVLYGPEQNGEMQQAAVTGRLSLRGDCLYLHGEGGEAEWPLLPVVWPNGTTWQESPEGVRLPDATFVPVGAWVTASGGFPDIGRLVELGHDQEVADRAQTCDVEGAGFATYVQGSVTAAKDEWRTVELLWFEALDATRLEVTLSYCGSNYRFDVKETADAVTIRAETSAPEYPPAPDCATAGVATLESPLGSRQVIDAATGAAVERR